MKIFVIATAVLALGLGACATAAPPADDVVATVKDGATQVKQVCRRETPTGQTIPVRTCKTAEEWAAYDKDTIEGRRQHEDALKRDGGFIR